MMRLSKKVLPTFFETLWLVLLIGVCIADPPSAMRMLERKDLLCRHDERLQSEMGIRQAEEMEESERMRGERTGKLLCRA
jgi:hypothetical protein